MSKNKQAILVDENGEAVFYPAGGCDNRRTVWKLGYGVVQTSEVVFKNLYLGHDVSLSRYSPEERDEVYFGGGVSMPFGQRYCGLRVIDV